ncbi:unnamed protein product [Linum tenue]|uniref:Calmodulin binding protein-like N-terminal domain-containing protein n=1 Tax=Linum tenue TaxID=586396 RepID=A0AAV0NYW6_9ROSI|nr:unnamed protein product [Linum tenue]
MLIDKTLAASMEKTRDRGRVGNWADRGRFPSIRNPPVRDPQTLARRNYEAKVRAAKTAEAAGVNNAAEPLQSSEPVEATDNGEIEGGDLVTPAAAIARPAEARTRASSPPTAIAIPTTTTAKEGEEIVSEPNLPSAAIPNIITIIDEQSNHSEAVVVLPSSIAREEVQAVEIPCEQQLLPTSTSTLDHLASPASPTTVAAASRTAITSVVAEESFAEKIESNLKVEEVLQVNLKEVEPLIGNLLVKSSRFNWKFRKKLKPDEDEKPALHQLGPVVEEKLKSTAEVEQSPRFAPFVASRMRSGSDRQPCRRMDCSPPEKEEARGQEILSCSSRRKAPQKPSASEQEETEKESSENVNLAVDSVERLKTTSRHATSVGRVELTSLATAAPISSDQLEACPWQEVEVKKASPSWKKKVTKEEGGGGFLGLANLPLPLALTRIAQQPPSENELQRLVNKNTKPRASSATLFAATSNGKSFVATPTGRGKTESSGGEFGKTDPRTMVAGSSSSLHRLGKPSPPEKRVPEMEEQKKLAATVGATREKKAEEDCGRWFSLLVNPRSCSPLGRSTWAESLLCSEEVGHELAQEWKIGGPMLVARLNLGYERLRRKEDTGSCLGLEVMMDRVHGDRTDERSGPRSGLLENRSNKAGAMGFTYKPGPHLWKINGQLMGCIFGSSIQGMNWKEDTEGEVLIGKIPELVEKSKDKGKEESNIPSSACSSGSVLARLDVAPKSLWTPDLHGLFVECVNALGVPQKHPRVKLLGLTEYFLQFASTLAPTIFIDNWIVAKGGSPVRIELLDASINEIVTLWPFASLEIEVVVLNGEFVSEDWSDRDFGNNVVRARDVKRPLVTRELNVWLRNGVGKLSNEAFTDNSSWKKCRNFRLGARVVQKYSASREVIRVKEARSAPFVVKDHRGCE